MAEKERVDAYLHTLSLMEPDIHPTDRDASLTSIAISLKRIAVAEETLSKIAQDFLALARKG